jgi:hypothetical protein
MKPMVRLLGVLVGLPAVVWVAGGAVPGLPGGPDVLGLGRLGAWYARELQRAEALSARTRAVDRCLEGKSQVAAEVGAGRMTLAEAVGHFRRLQRQVKDDGQDKVLGAYPLSPSDEELARQVVDWVANQLHNDPERAAGVVARLRGELRQRTGGVRGSAGEPH